MPPPPSKDRPTRPRSSKKRPLESVDGDALATAVAELDPSERPAVFDELPLSPPTRAGLAAAHFATLTDIQAHAIPLALRGRDILAAARTGSGKTLAFLVPVLENLYRAECAGPDAGLGALIISPTRELAIQIFDVLRRIGGRGHQFAAGLVIGGKGLREERDAVGRMNILVCTPGRILQHLSQTATFHVDNLRMLVLDEADRIMDMGFQRDVDAIIEYLPQDRQTLLFSATQTKRLSDLSRLALRDPAYLSVHEAAPAPTPGGLQQHYTVTPLPEKLDTLWSFLQSSKKSKILVFLSSGKQVRFVFESFRRMQPGIPLLHLHGRQRQTARLEITQKFSRAQYGCLFATDVVARGLDFPAVDWVIQVDCPEDVDTYIHRVGRTARYERAGRAVLFLDPSEEEGMRARLTAKHVPVELINARRKKQQSIRNHLQSMCFQDPALKYLSQKAFSCYVQSLRVQKDKEVFRLDEYDLEDFAASLGLPGAPRIKFRKADADEVKRKKNAPRQQEGLLSESESGEEEGGEDGGGGGVAAGKKAVRTKYDRMFERRNQDVLADHYAKMVRRDDEKGHSGSKDDDDDDNGDDADDLFDVKRRIPVEEPLAHLDLSENEKDVNGGGPDEQEDNVGDDSHPKSIQIPGARAPLILDSNRRARLLQSKKKLLKLKEPGQRLVFDDDGTAHAVYELEDEAAFRARGAAEEQRERFVQAEGERVRVADGEDRAVEKGKRKEKAWKRKEREKAEAEAEAEAKKGAGRVRVDGEEEEDAMANFLADAKGASGEEEDVAEEEEEAERRKHPRKRKKGFKEDDENDDGENGKKKRKKRQSRGEKEAENGDREITTLDDLEAEATKLLA